MRRPVCRRCGVPLDLMPSLDESGAYELDCNSRRDREGKVIPESGLQDDAAFQTAWDNLPGDWVVRLEKQMSP